MLLFFYQTVKLENTDLIVNRLVLSVLMNPVIHTLEPVLMDVHQDIFNQTARIV